MNKEIETSLGRFDFNKATKVTITKDNDNDIVIAEFTTKEAKFVDTKNSDLIIKIGNKKYKVLEVTEKEGD